jgi:MoxR-like ATPase
MGPEVARRRKQARWRHVVESAGERRTVLCKNVRNKGQMDRFLMHVTVGYPDEQAEAGIVRLNRAEEPLATLPSATAPASPGAPGASAAAGPGQADEAPIAPQLLFDAGAEIHALTVLDAVE